MKTTGMRMGALLSCGLLFVGRLLAGDSVKTSAVGDAAPPVMGKDQDGKEWKLSDALGKNIVLLYFYPKDDTPGCTRRPADSATAWGVKERGRRGHRREF